MKKVLLFSLVLVIAASVLASYPNRSVTLVIPWAAGGITDRVGRAFAPYLEKYLGVPVVVLNQPGASGAIGTDFAYSKPADGYTLLLSAETPGVFRVMGTGKLGFDNFEGIMMLVEDTKVVVVPGNSPYQTMDELVTAIKENP
ncbi:tripartite tricarboxylate transporter substrate-binding protein, partial [uncultured Mesotoga sp.]